MCFCKMRFGEHGPCPRLVHDASTNPRTGRPPFLGVESVRVLDVRIFVKISTRLRSRSYLIFDENPYIQNASAARRPDGGGARDSQKRVPRKRMRTMKRNLPYPMPLLQYPHDARGADIVRTPRRVLESSTVYFQVVTLNVDWSFVHDITSFVFTSTTPRLLLRRRRCQTRRHHPPSILQEERRRFYLCSLRTLSLRV
jgi:hypothetical protein